MLVFPLDKDWLPLETWPCLLSVLTTYISSSNLEVYSEVNILPLVVASKWALYISDRFDPMPQPALPAVTSALLIYKSLPQVYLSRKYERVIVVTEDLENVTTLWTRSRILETVVLVPNKTKLNAFTWFPYRRKTCYDKPTLHFIDVCQQENWNKNLFPQKVPKQFSGCPVYYKSISSPPDNIQEPDGSFSGREPVLMEIIASALNLSVLYKPSTMDFYNIGDGGDNIGDMIFRGEVDFGFASILMSYDFNVYTELLPCYRDQPIEWMLPLAKEKSQISSIYSVFPYEMWATVAIIIILTGLLLTLISNFEGLSWHWTDMVAVTLALPINTSNSLFIRLFMLFFQFYSLHIAWFYQGTLLKNLVTKPMEPQITDVTEALDAKLPVYLYPWLDFYFNLTDHDQWNRILLPENHHLTFDISYDDVVVKKKAFLLGVTIRDGYALRNKYQKNLSDMVYLAPFVNSLVSVFGHRGSPLTLLYTKIMYSIFESGIFLHLTVLESGYVDLPREKVENIAQTLTLEPLQGIFYSFFALLIISFIVFLIEVIIVSSDNWLRRIGYLKKKRLKRSHFNVNIR